MTKPVINIWANFLMNEKLYSPRVNNNDLMQLIRLCEEAAKVRAPCIRMHKDKLESRRFIVGLAMDLGIDLPAMRHRGKVAMGRGLLDMWNIVYAERFESTVGTAGAKEADRRDVKTSLTEDKT